MIVAIAASAGHAAVILRELTRRLRKALLQVSLTAGHSLSVSRKRPCHG